LLDRFDLVVPLDRPTTEDLLSENPGESSARVAARVAAARARAQHRAASQVEPPLAPEAVKLLEEKLRDGLLSARGLQKVKRVARTVADLEGQDVVAHAHVSEAISLRAGRRAIVT
jgi:magnesium chelatase family protein